MNSYSDQVRWTVVAGGDGYQTATVVGWAALELAFLRAHEPDATLEDPGEFGGSVLAHLRAEENWNCGMNGDRLHYHESYEDGWVEVIRHTDDLVGTDGIRERPDAEALDAVPSLKGKHALVLYFQDAEGCREAGAVLEAAFKEQRLVRTVKL